MSENIIQNLRWYEKDELTSKFIEMFENLSDSNKRKTAIFLVDEIINKPPYKDMVSEDVFNAATSESQKRRWYDFDEVIRIFAELLKNLNEEAKKEIAVKAVLFMQDLG